jgi:hypothetical protein
MAEPPEKELRVRVITAAHQSLSSAAIRQVNDITTP